ncbi:BTAD domain-containing putative transcriptional regulator [Aeromicrobium massiliense]|uniref:BTAD domain-containing putative transcriptional regulator n=1 Tax=Aeromicrobium massiliense TaxID=1464554 RepID=UPI0002D6469F|nr:BTAD domain-containing putative transcriptional regulator [Aeromicrobium massiliense]
MKVNVLGPMTITRGEQHLDVGPRRSQEVLSALLVRAGDVVPLETLIDEVWGDSRVAPGSVHVVVSRLRSRIGGDLIRTQAPGYRIALEGHELDADVFEAHLRTARETQDPSAARASIHAALALWRGDAYADVQLRVARTEADRLHAMRLSAHHQLAQLDLDEGRHHEVAERLSALVDAYPLEEGLLAPLMLALYRSGRQAEALATYDRARRCLDEELGVEPTPATRDMHQRILRQDESLAPVPAAAPTQPATPDRPGLIGRQQELGRLARALHHGWFAGLSVTAVVGEAGIGKTRLVEEAAALAHEDGGLVAFGRCWDTEGTPALWPWEQVLSSLSDRLDPDLLDAATSGRGQLARVLLRGSDEDPATAVNADVAPARLYDAVTAFVEVVSSRRPLLLVLEDMHWADPGSVELMDYLLATCRGGRLAVVLTVRDPDESAVRTTPLTASLARSAGTTRIDLSGLDVPQVQELAARSLGSSITLTAAQALRDRTDGNPFYVGELARLYGDERRRTGRGDTPVPKGVRAVIERRLRHLPAGDVAALTAAAVIGRTFGLLLLEDVTSTGRLALLETIDRATTAGILTAADDVLEYRFGHALVQETLTLSMSLARRSSVHAAVAEALQTRHGHDPHFAAAVAHHHVEAHPYTDASKAIRASLHAAALAQQRLAFDDAERLVRRALDLVDAVPTEQATALEIELRVKLGSLLTLRHGYNGPGVAEERRRVLELSGPGGAVSDIFSAHWGTWGNALVSGHFDEARTSVQGLQDVADSTTDPMFALAADVARGQTSWHLGHLPATRTALKRAVERSDRCDRPLDLDLWLQHPGVQARIWLALAVAQQGEVDLSHRIAREAETLAEQSGHLYTMSFQLIAEGVRSVVLDRPEQAAEQSRRGQELAVANEFLQLQAFALMPLGWGAGRLGDTETGLAMLNGAIDAFSSLSDRHLFGPFMLRLAADLHGRAGRRGEALRLTEAALLHTERTGERFDLVDLHLLRARLLADDDVAAADEEHARATRVAIKHGAHLYLARQRCGALSEGRRRGRAGPPTEGA